MVQILDFSHDKPIKVISAFAKGCICLYTYNTYTYTHTHIYICTHLIGVKHLKELKAMNINLRKAKALSC